MKIRLTTNLIYQILFAICIGVTYLNIYELTFAMWSATFLFTLKKAYSVTVIKYIMCFAAIFGIALISAYFNSQKTYNLFRDMTYLVKPILGILVGYQLCRNINIKPLYTLLYTGLFIAGVHLVLIAYSIVIYRIINIHELRYLTGYFSDFEIYALIIACFSTRFNIELTYRKKVIFIAILGISSFLYLSRTNFIQFFIFFIGMLGYLKLNKRSLIIMGSMILAATAFYSVIYHMNFTRNGKGLDGLMYKIKNAPIEAFKTKIKTDDYRDFNDNYRSYENIITIRQVSNQGTSMILFGKGMGATIDLGREVWSNDGEFIRYIPVLHNGFMTIYLKSGLAGIFVYLIFLFFLCRQSHSDIPIVNEINLILTATGIFLIMATWVLLGLYLKIENKSIIIGFLLCYKELVNKASYRQIPNATT